MSTTLDARAKVIFGDALELKGTERAAYIAAASAGDHDLRRRVETLLAAAEREDSFLADRQTMTLAAEVSLGRNDRIGNYTLLEKLGEGGFGTVYLAEQTHPVRRRIALKIIKLGMDTRAVIARFEQERQALAIMDHPNIARVFDAGTTETGRPYFVMELVTGEPITTYCDKHKLSIRERLELLMQVCRAVQHAHTKGIIHRDIKPSNILVTAHDGPGVQAQCKVIDFGIAKAIQRELTGQTAFTRDHQLIGTPEYMSPEQAAGSPDIDTRSDVYSLGVLAYELLAGATPFDPQRLRSAAYGELLRIIREDDPPTPSTRVSQMHDQLASIASHRQIEPRRLGSIIRGELDWMVMRALEKDPARRYDSAGNMAADIERYLAGLPVEAAPPGAAYRLRKFVRRRRGAVVAASLIAGALLLGTAGTTIGLVRARAAQADAQREATAARDSAEVARAEAQRADREAEEARLNAKVADSVNQLMTTMVRRANRAREQGRADVTVREVMDAAAAELIESPGAHEARVEMLLAGTIGATYRELSLFDDAERMLRLAAERARLVFGERSIQYGENASNLGALLKFRGQRAAAAEMYAKARAAFTAAGTDGERQLAMLRINNAALIADEGRLDEARVELRESIAWFESAATPDEPPPEQYFTALHNLAAVEHMRGDAASAEAMLHRIVERRRAVFGDDDPEILKSLQGLVVLQVGRQDLAGAETSIREQLALARRLHGDDHIVVADLMDTLGNILIRRGDGAGAAAAFGDAAMHTKKLLSAQHAETARRTATWAACLMDLGRDGEAEPLLREALATWRPPAGVAASALQNEPSAPQVVHSDILIAQYRLGVLLERRGELASAVQLLRAAHASAPVSLSEGDRHKWMEHAIASLLGSVLLAQSAALPEGQRAERLREAGELIVPSAEHLLALAPTMGPRMRALAVPAAVERSVRLHTVLHERSPSPEAAAALAVWTGRLREVREGEAK